MRVSGAFSWLKFGLLTFLVCAFLAIAMDSRTRQMDRIRHRLWQLELGMTIEEVRDSVDDDRISDVREGSPRDGRDSVGWSFAMRPRIEAVQPYLVFDGDTEELIEIVVDESRQRKTVPSGLANPKRSR